MRVYLGGGKGEWREEFRKFFPTWVCYDPFKDSDQRSIANFTLDDLQAVADSDIVVFHIDYERYTGSCIEAGFAYAFGKPIIFIFLLKGMLPPMFSAISQKVFTDFDMALRWIKRRFEE